MNEPNCSRCARSRDLLAPAQWAAAADAVRTWAAALHDTDPSAAFVASDSAFRVTPLDDALTHDDRQFGRITVHPLMSAARQLLDALARPGAV
jgi:hypothetical protein